MLRRLSDLWLNATSSFVFLLLSLFLIPQAQAQADFAENQAGRVALLSAVDGVGQADHLEAGLAFELKPGWKIYWRVPGDAGYPPKLDWDQSTNVKTPQLAWPAPHRTIDEGLQSIGYMGTVVFPLSMAVVAPGQPVHLQLALDYLACEKICVPLEATLTLHIPAGPADPSIHAHRLAQALASVPVPGASLGWTIAKSTVAEGSLEVVVRSETPFVHPDLFVEDGASTSFLKPQVSLSEANRVAAFSIAKVGSDVIGKSLTFTLVDEDKSGELTTAVSVAKASQSLWIMIFVALLGGVVLNLMPCVLPILSLKMLALLAHSGGHRLEARAAFLASSVGIITSFLGLALILIAIKSAGHAVGWGLQFQQPVFIALMMLILAAFAANLFGLFEIPLPSWLGNVGTGSSTLTGHFLSGFLATLLATPCSAPFVGTAIGYALSRGPQEIIAIFLSLGVGMALPFLSVAVWPELATKLPHPGPWMLLVKRLMAVCLAVTALWLAWVLVGIVGDSTPTKPGTHSAVPWTPFEQAKIAEQVAQGQVVFVDVTADWCITCKVNKLTVIERGEVAQSLSQPGVVAMQADWTKPDETISRYLASFGRYGIPFDVVYGPAAPEGIALPELITTEAVITALHAAKP